MKCDFFLNFILWHFSPQKFDFQMILTTILLILTVVVAVDLTITLCCFGNAISVVTPEFIYTAIWNRNGNKHRMTVSFIVHIKYILALKWMLQMCHRLNCNWIVMDLCSYKCSVDLQLHISLVVTLQSTGAESVSVEIVPTRHRENKVFWNFLVRARVTVLMARSRC